MPYAWSMIDARKQHTLVSTAHQKVAFDEICRHRDANVIFSCIVHSMVGGGRTHVGLEREARVRGLLGLRDWKRASIAQIQ